MMTKIFTLILKLVVFFKGITSKININDINNTLENEFNFTDFVEKIAFIPDSKQKMILPKYEKFIMALSDLGDASRLYDMLFLSKLMHGESKYQPHQNYNHGLTCLYELYIKSLRIISSFNSDEVRWLKNAYYCKMDGEKVFLSKEINRIAWGVKWNLV